MGYIPRYVNTVAFSTLVDSYKSCLDTKGTIYYNRIAGGMKYSNSDLLRIELIISLLKSVDGLGLDCIFDEVVFPGLAQSDFSDPVLTATGYLQNFLNFANQFCKDCITSTPVGAVGPGEDLTSHLFSQTGTEITLQSGAPIILY